MLLRFSCILTSKEGPNIFIPVLSCSVSQNIFKARIWGMECKGQKGTIAGALITKTIYDNKKLFPLARIMYGSICPLPIC